MALVEFAGVSVVTMPAYLRASRAKTRAVVFGMWATYALYAFGVTL